MRSAYKLIAGNSLVAPVGIAVAIVLIVTLHDILGRWAAPAYIGVLLCTLAISTAEPVR